MQIHPLDNVEVRADGQKYALSEIKKGENVMKYGFPIGSATENIEIGDRVSPKNLSSNLKGMDDWEYIPAETSKTEGRSGTFSGYLRKDGSAGIRNELWIIPTVGCINDVAKTLAAKSGGKALCHPYGCSQLGGDLLNTQKILCGLIRHPNAGGVLVLGLGCEENGIAIMKTVLGDYDKDRVKFLNIQDCEDEIADGMAIIADLKARMEKDERTDIPVSKLNIAVKCGGSDGYSGITANPLVGRAMEYFAEYGGTVLMTEIPEVFGAEQLLLSRSVSKEAFASATDMIKAFRQYFIDHGEGIADNPSPGNIAGGISTLEEKSLGCVQKAGKVPLMGALGFGEKPESDGGLYLVNGPGNDMVAVTNLAASGAHIILFTTGRGTPLSAPVPTLKIATNSALAAKKPHWIDFNAGVLLDGADMGAEGEKLFELCLSVANGAKPKSEENGYYDIAIFKDGVTL
ncbi:MAG: UxaA family hydrolase [Acutalibacteraceae bacterium]|nr:UxaA family hydrolase [Acutalibacteraceae bacterium]